MLQTQLNVTRVKQTIDLVNPFDAGVAGLV